MAELAEGPLPATVERLTVDGVVGATVDVIHARPGAEHAAGIVVHPDIMGVRPLFDDLCRRLATHGFAVCAPEPFARAPLEVREAPDPSARMEAMPSLDDEVQIGDLVAAADLLVAIDGVGPVHVIGFCMGGMQTLKAAATGRFARAVAFYGMIRVPEQWRGGALREPLDTARDVCPTLAIFGSADSWTPPSDIDALREAWAERPDCEIVVYDDADHGFVHAPERPTHRAGDAADAWSRALAFLR
jgi:carboxymethylenebutenolidase